MIPIRDITGRVIAFGGRDLPLSSTSSSSALTTAESSDSSSRKVAKYINSPGSSLFTKKRSLFGVDLARPVCHTEGHVLIVEGYMDVIALHEAGVKCSVASMGTSVTLEQLLLAASLSPQRKVILLLDGDEAGQAAAIRAMKIVAKHDERLRLGGIVSAEDRASFAIDLYLASIAEAAIPFMLKANMTVKEKGNDSGAVLFDPNRHVVKDCGDLLQLLGANEARRVVRQIIKQAKPAAEATAVITMDSSKEEEVGGGKKKSSSGSSSSNSNSSSSKQSATAVEVVQLNYDDLT